ncbi:MAG: cysteine desulfurase family protein [Pirellulales bacterium]
MHSIYLDHNSTTPPLSEVIAAMAACAAESIGNPSSQHVFGRRARQRLEAAREGIARALGADTSGREPDRVVFTSGGTEANNLALFGLAGQLDPLARPGQAVISAIEHPSVTGPVEVLERRGWTIHRLRVTADGVVDLAALDECLSEHTRFVSVMLANNETGAVQPVVEIAKRCAALGVLLHTDAAQVVGKLPVNFRALGVSAMTIAAHKFHGPIGTGALVLRHGVRLEPQLRGGFQQEGLRPGTEAVPLAVGMQTALDCWQREAAARAQRLRALRDRLEQGIVEGCSGEGGSGEIRINAAGAERLPNTSNVAFIGLDRQALLMALDLAGVACSTGSACASGSSEPSHVLAAMGCERRVLTGSLRFSLGATTTVDEIDAAVARIVQVYEKLAVGRRAVAR